MAAVTHNFVDNSDQIIRFILNPFRVTSPPSYSETEFTDVLDTIFNKLGMDMSDQFSKHK